MRKPYYKYLFLINIFGAFLIPDSSAAQLLKVIVGSDPPVEISVRTVHVQEEPFIPLDEMAQSAGWNVSLEKTLYVLTITFGSHEVRVAGDNPFLIVDGNLFQMPIESKHHAGHVYVPIRYFFPLLAQRMPDVIRYDPTGNVVEIAGKPPKSPGAAQPEPASPVVQAGPESPAFAGGFNLADLSIEEKANGTLVRIRAARMFRPQDFSSWLKEEDGWLYVQIYGGRLDPVSIAIRKGEGFIDRIVPVQQPQLAQISLKLNQQIESHEVGQDPRTKEILITLYKKMTATPTLDAEITGLLKNQQKTWEIDVITLDAGHGGEDPGTIGRYHRTKEKDVALDVTLRLGKLIQSRTGIKVIYTRDDDTFIPLWQRTRIANQAKSKLFISIHANSVKRGNANGFEIYILRPGKDAAAIEVAEKENSVVKEYEKSETEYEGFLNGKKMIYSIMQSGFVKESEELAAQVSKGMNGTVNPPNRGVKQAGLLVLWRASMPNILVEVGFLSSKTEEANLRNPQYRQKVAEGVFRGIASYVQQKEQNMARAAGSSGD